MNHSKKNQPSAKHSSVSSPVTKDERLQAEAAYRWGITPSSDDKQESDPAKTPPDHPVHKISPEEQQKMRRKGINPVLKAEMDEATRQHGKGGSFWSKFGLNATGAWRR
ncbi:hypothetical protein QQS21_008510 [Conoideocrella luteorostrata]|uniref:Uncharacterized protein n=1 Tax=Conoideocrella luteorostrata TaxID=1105319 RepID=A0AAJ0FRD6_9HYPO|nr:hypothetical protein QQS21_008510 [Conoideocrella luteorostrata]